MVVDEFIRQGLDIRVGRNITTSHVIRILDELFQMHGPPVCLRSDNGPELVSHAVQEWLKDKHVDTHYIDAGSAGRMPITKASTRYSGPLVWADGCSVQ